MAWNFAASPSLRTTPWIQAPERLPTKNHSLPIKLTSFEKFSSTCKAAQAEGVTEEPALEEGSSARSQIDLLEQLTSSTSISGSESGGNSRRPTIREQLSEITGDSGGDFSLPLGKKLKEGLKTLNKLTISQRRNIKRQAYLDEVSKRNDSVFYATIGAFVILPPAVILSIAILTGYVQFFP